MQNSGNVTGELYSFLSLKLDVLTFCNCNLWWLICKRLQQETFYWRILYNCTTLCLLFVYFSYSIFCLCIFSCSSFHCIFIGYFTEFGYLTKIEIFQIQDIWRTDAILKIVFGISQRHIGRLMWNQDRRWRITCRYYVTWPTRQFSQIQDGRWPPFWK